MKTHYLFILLLLVQVTNKLVAQDIHFSHFEFSPLTLNPGLAGANSPMQAIVNYRSQWKSVATPFKTFAASFDARFNEKSRNKKGIFAGGINFFNDQSGDLKVTTNTASLNLAYHLILDRKNTLGLGMYTGFGQRSIQPSNGRWGSQYDGFDYNPLLQSGENTASASFSYLDAGAGLVYTYKKNEGYMTQNDQLAINGGLATYHVNRPSFSFIDKTSDRLYMRWSAFVNAEVGIKNTRGSLLPGIYYQRQGPTQEILYGLYYKYILSSGSKITGFTRPASLSIGLFNRFRDALVGKIMFEWDVISAGFAYDINISTLADVSNAKGGFDLFLRFNLGDGGGFRSRI